MEFWTTDYQELERELVSGHGGREELYQVSLGILVQAFIETVNNNQLGELLIRKITLVYKVLKRLKDEFRELHLDGV